MQSARDREAGKVAKVVNTDNERKWAMSVNAEYPDLELTKLFELHTNSWFDKPIGRVRDIYQFLYGQATNKLEEHVLDNMLQVIKNYEEDVRRFPASAYKRLDVGNQSFGGWKPRSMRA